MIYSMYGLLFSIFVVIATGLVLFSLRRQTNVLRRFGVLCIGILIFELFTQPLWGNDKLPVWSYIYQDVSWVLTIGWATILLFSMAISHRFVKEEKRWFFASLGIAAFIGIVAEAWVRMIGIRTYSPEVVAMSTGIQIPLTNVPIGALYYMPVFMALIIGFTRYIEQSLDAKPIRSRRAYPSEPVKKTTKKTESKRQSTKKRSNRKKTK